MFLVLGVRVRLKILDRGTFHCARCGGDRPYARVERRRWFAVFFVPVAPMGRGDVVVRCEACGTLFEEAALAAPTSDQRATTALAALRAVAMALVVRADTPATVAALVRVLREAGVAGYGDTDLAWDRQSGAGARALDLVGTVAPTMPLPERERFLARAAAVGLADGIPILEVLSYLHQVGTALGLSRAHTEGVIAQARRDVAG